MGRPQNPQPTTPCDETGSLGTEPFSVTCTIRKRLVGVNTSAIREARFLSAFQSQTTKSFGY